MTWRLEVACSNSSWANILWCSVWESNSESFRKLLLRQQRLPVSPTEQNSTSDETRTHKPLGHLVLSQTCIPFHHRSMILKVGLEPTYHKATDPKSAVSPIAPLEHNFFTLRGTCTLNPSRQLGLNPSCILNSTIRAYFRGRMESNHRHADFQSVATTNWATST